MSVRPHIVPVVSPQRPDPPKELRAAEKNQWQAYVTRMPASWFTAEVQPLLIDLCRAVCMSKYFADRLHEVTVDLEGLESRLLTENPALDDERLQIAVERRLDRVAEYAKLQEAQARIVKTNSTALRLTQQSRYTPDMAAVRTRTEEPKRRLWES
jgi:hypothetical protein